MKTIPLQKSDLVTMVDDEDYQWLSQCKWRLMPQNRVYRKRSRKSPLFNRTMYMHQALLHYPTGMCVDHKDGNPLNNQKSNLRVCFQKNNVCNSKIRKTNTSGAKGVDFMKKEQKWRARVGSRHLGLFSSFSDAVQCYNRECVKSFGEFARPNVI